jgi:2-oxoglutarate dehydrogenase E2 component (dihydrolipoamide succinyltransferase)
MRIELTVPSIGESITEVEIGGWLKKPGEPVRKDEPVVTLESEKATVELPSPESGTLAEVLKQKGEVARVGEVIARLETAPGATPPPKAAEAKPAETPAPPKGEARPASKPAEPRVMPAAQRELAERGLRAEEVAGTGPGGRILKEDVLRHATQTPPKETLPVSPVTQVRTPPPEPAPSSATPAGREEEVVPMSRLRRTVAERLVAAQHNAALLTTFNEIDMGAVLALRKEYGEAFHRKYEIKLGFMSFFVKACTDALKLFPALNAEVRGTNIVYHNFCDIGVAVGGGKGLVVPLLRNAERLSFAQIELAIADFARRAKENKLKLEELEGGTFTISNGGVYGSLLSTPIVNPPQSGVLGLHAIQERPVAREGNVVIRPMMYVALTYDHRVVDGREAVSFLKRIKDVMETPTRMLMEV